MKKIDFLKNKVEEYFNTLNNENILDVIKKQSLEYYLKEINKLKEISEIKKYKIVFIGPNGSGKTTLLSNLFNIINSDARELLSVGAGGTTISEVEIKFSRNQFSEFHIEFIPEKELLNIIHDFALSHFPNPENINANSFISQEVYRALKNILNFPAEQIDFQNEIDCLLNQSNNSFQEFLDLLVERSSHDSEIFKEYIYDQINPQIDEKIWIKRTFSAINVSKIEGCSIPKKITLILGNHFWDERYHNIHALIDTKGLDNALEREDIDNYIKSNDSICIFTTKYDNAPNGDIQEFIRRNLDKETNYLSSKNFVILLPRNDEPNQLINQQGERIDDWIEGVNVKLLHTINTICGLANNFNRNHIKAIDVKYLRNGYLSESEKSYNLNQINSLISSINSIIEDRIESIELCNYYNVKVDSIINIEAIDNNFIDELNTVITKIRNQNIGDFVFNDYNFNIGFINRIQRFHHMVVHAINRRHGIYHERSIDLSYILIGAIRELTFLQTNRYLERIKSIIEELNFNKFDLSNIKELLINSIDESYNIFLESIVAFVSEIVKEDYFEFENEIWLNLINEYGRGPGFLTRVHNHYTNHLKPLENKLINIISENWKTIVINPILSFLKN